tara:strand:- start:460 stop:597 length:138 start_codon:yes stop_codon:yes gene_type:complete
MLAIANTTPVAEIDKVKAINEIIFIKLLFVSIKKKYINVIQANIE